MDPIDLRYGGACPCGLIEAVITGVNYFSRSWTCMAPSRPNGKLGSFYVSSHDFPAEKDPNYPHKCPKCKGPSYQGCTPASKVDCKGKCGV